MMENFFKYDKVKFSYEFNAEEGTYEVTQEVYLRDLGITSETDFKVRELIIQRAFRKWLYQELNPKYELTRS